MWWKVAAEWCIIRPSNEHLGDAYCPDKWPYEEIAHEYAVREMGPADFSDVIRPEKWKSEEWWE